MIGEELDPLVHPHALVLILRRYKEQAGYWGYATERTNFELRDFAKQVEIAERLILEVWKEVSKEDS